MARALIVLLAVLGLASCHRPPGQAHTDPRRWSCGTAAGICTCVAVDTDVGAASHACGASGCCFISDDGSCSCRLEGAAMDCPALMTALYAKTRVAACPP